MYSCLSSIKTICMANGKPQAVKSNPPFDYVLHTASPFHFNVQDPVKDFLDPAIKGTTGILKAIKAYSPTVKRVVVTSSFASIVNPDQHPPVYSEEHWNPVTWEQALDHSKVYRASKVSQCTPCYADLTLTVNLDIRGEGCMGLC
jgi:nucleoside-diphosphate-sugar epimerase